MPERYSGSSLAVLFVARSVYNTVVLASIEKCAKFSDLAITDSELVDSADIYLSDEDMAGTYRKVKLKLD